MYQLDVKSAFLNGFLKEEIYVQQPEGFVVKGEEAKVLRLKKTSYGLKQTPRAWYSRIDDFLLKIGFNKSLSESTLYVRIQDCDIIVISLYVDNLLVTGSNFDLVKQFKDQMLKTFEMIDLGEMSYFLGMEIVEKLCICERGATEIQYGNLQNDKHSTLLMQNEKLCKDDGVDKVNGHLYRSLIGCLMYLTATRPNILYVVNLLSRFMHCASELHFKTAKRVLRYIKGTIDYGVMFKRS